MCRHLHLAVHSQTPNQRPIFTRGHQPAHVARIRNAYARVAALHLHTKSIPYLRLFLFFLFFSIRRVSLRIVTRQPPQLCPSGARRSSIVRCCCIRPSLNVRFTTAAHIHLPLPPPPPSSPLGRLPSLFLPSSFPLPSFLLTHTSTCDFCSRLQARVAATVSFGSPTIMEQRYRSGLKTYVNRLTLSLTLVSDFPHE